MFTRPDRLRLFTVLVGATFAGCSEEIGPPLVARGQVRGRVVVGGRPLETGWVEYLPVGGTIGDLGNAPIGPGGAFAAEGVPVGTHAVRVVGAPLPPDCRALGQGFLVRRSVTPGAPADWTIDLRQEAFRLAQSPAP